MLSILIVDDERPARMRLRAMLEPLPGYQVVAEAVHGEEALSLVESHNPDIVMLDIRMPGLDGLAVANRLALKEHSPAIIFCTAFDEHAMAALDAQATAYLLKPIAREKLVLALSRCQVLSQTQLSALVQIQGGSNVETRTIPVPCRGGIERLAFSEIRALVADNKYVSAYTEKREILLDQSLKELEAAFPLELVRVHRNALVVRQHIRALEKRSAPEGGEQLVVCLDDTDIAPVVSRRHLAEIRRLIKQL